MVDAELQRWCSLDALERSWWRLLLRRRRGTDPSRRRRAPMSHPILQGKPIASHVCAKIILHTHDRQNECNTIAVTNRSRVKPVRYPLLHPERWTRRSEHNDN
jgi:hypothetical protein